MLRIPEVIHSIESETENYQFNNHEKGYSYFGCDQSVPEEIDLTTLINIIEKQNPIFPRKSRELEYKKESKSIHICDYCGKVMGFNVRKPFIHRNAFQEPPIRIFCSKKCQLDWIKEVRAKNE